jgi:hypothetical protein
LHAVAGEDADKIFAHLAADLRQHDVLAVIQTDAEKGVGQFIYHDALGRDEIIFSQTKSPLVKSSAPRPSGEDARRRALPEVGGRVCLPESRRRVVVSADVGNLDAESAPATMNFNRVGRFSGMLSNAK